MKKVRRLIILVGCLIAAGCSESNFTDYVPEKDCVPAQLENGIAFKCADGSTYEIKDGEDGLDGLDAVNSIVTVVPLCPNLSGAHKEVVLNIDGLLVAYFAQNGNAQQSRLTILEEGTLYTTTDTNNNQCRFTVLDGEVIYE